ncbi:hypothetical protein [Nostoc sp. FACHB-280]|uniref:hypothetical protein n=1 Tax=Nostoc sp. FACHB-280 TaxID=2692839 RepID=UPI00168B9D48|nr:hypothetical protein [Nostoc sp. FACHB-280]MBD2498741.1 hypothetical protein [Nostoc sp. FACHB-280]
MVSTELLNTLQGLSRAEKLYVVQVLISELAQQEADLIKPEQSYPVWSPYNAIDAANTMLEVLQTTQNQSNGEC